MEIALKWSKSFAITKIFLCLGLSCAHLSASTSSPWSSSPNYLTTRGHVYKANVTEWTGSHFPHHFKSNFKRESFEYSVDKILLIMNFFLLFVLSFVLVQVICDKVEQATDQSPNMPESEFADQSESRLEPESIYVPDVCAQRIKIGDRVGIHLVARWNNGHLFCDT